MTVPFKRRTWMPEADSLIASLVSLPGDQRAALLADLTEAEAEALLWDWRAWARPNQIAPLKTHDGNDWLTWPVPAGPGCGKTRGGGAFAREEGTSKGGGAAAA